jgi:hypothetical protein
MDIRLIRKASLAMTLNFLRYCIVPWEGPWEDGYVIWDNANDCPANIYSYSSRFEGQADCDKLNWADAENNSAARYRKLAEVVANQRKAHEARIQAPTPRLSTTDVTPLRHAEAATERLRVAWGAAEPATEAVIYNSGSTVMLELNAEEANDLADALEFIVREL